MDRPSDLSDELLLIILSLIPTRAAARTSILSRRFRHLWEASTRLDLICRDLPEPQKANFCVLADRLLFRRNPHHPLLSLHLEISLGFDDRYVDSLLAKVVFLDLRHLTIEYFRFHINSALAYIFSMKSLQSLSLPALIDKPQSVIFYFDDEDTLDDYTLPSANLLFNFTGRRSQKTKGDWKPKLPRKADHSYYAYFRNLHLREDINKFLQLLGKKSTSKRHAHGALSKIKLAPSLYI